MGLLDGTTDFATVIANEPCRALLITRQVFEQLLMSDRQSLLQVIGGVLSGRMRESWLFHSIIGINDAESKIRATLAHYSKSLGVRDAGGGDHTGEPVASDYRRTGCTSPARRLPAF